jgi:hypothetical protein
MFTIDRSDGNLFLARQPRQSPSIKKNGADRDIHATVCLQSGGIGGIGRGIYATPQAIPRILPRCDSKPAATAKHQAAGLSRPLYDTAKRGEILTLVQRSGDSDRARNRRFPRGTRRFVAPISLPR